MVGNGDAMTAPDGFVDAYVEAMLWAGLDWGPVARGEDDNPVPLEDEHDSSDITDEAMAAIRSECDDFYDANTAELEGWGDVQAGHDFYLTRNRHGTGFWDRGRGAVGDRLSDAAHVYGESGESAEPDGTISYR